MMTEFTYPILYLKKQEERRLQKGSVWIYSNEIDTQRTPLKSFEPGSLVTLMSSKEVPLGIAFLNPKVLLAGRLLTRDVSQKIDANFFQSRFETALQWREACFDKPYYRLVYSESDGLPGLIIDRFDKVLSVQINTAGMDALKEVWLPVLQALLKPDTIYLGCDTAYRELEGLPLYTDFMGQSQAKVNLEENGVLFEVSLAQGQKTGWFYDQRENRAKLKSWVAGKSVLDAFCYAGGFGIPAACWGASQVTFIDSSADSLGWVKRNAHLNQLEDKISLMEGKAFELLAQLYQEGKTFDIVMIDPPAFIKKRKDKNQGLNAYYRLNELAAKLVKPNGLLVTSSCSMLLAREELVDVIASASAALNRPMQIVAEGHQACDHPIHPSLPETAYLKCFWVRVE